MLAACLLPPGCAAVPQLHAGLSDAEIKERLGANFQKGMTLPEVNARLDALDVSRDVRRAYAGDPPQLLVRLFPVGGYWVKNAEYQKTRYVDAWFVFTPQPPTLNAIDLDPRSMTFQAGTYIDPPFHNPSLLPSKPTPVPTQRRPEGDWITIR